MDHNTSNEDEIRRLERCGLDPGKLRRAKRLGMQQNTRSIGDYSIKGGYTSVDIIRSVSVVHCPAIFFKSERGEGRKKGGTVLMTHWLFFLLYPLKNMAGMQDWVRQYRKWMELYG